MQSNMAGKSKKRSRSKSVQQSKGAKRQKVESVYESIGREASDSQTKNEFSTKLQKALKMEMPDDFYDFYDFCKKLEPDLGTAALVETLGLELCGPYDMITGRLPVKESDEGDQENIKNMNGMDDGSNDDNGQLSYHLHSRFFYDPPEFMTLIKESSNRSCFHIGYFRDDPNELPAIVATNNADIDCIFTPCGDNVFAAVSSYAQNLLTDTRDSSKKKNIQELIKQLKDVAKELNYSLESMTSKVKERKGKVVTKSFHKAGIVVPLDGNEVGYRPLNLTDNALKKLLDKICGAKNEREKNQYSDELHELITFVQFANDECDYGMGLELGIDLFCYGNEAFKGQILQLLPLAYSLLSRELYGKIIKSHMDRRERFIDETFDVQCANLLLLN